MRGEKIAHWIVVILTLFLIVILPFALADVRKDRDKILTSKTFKDKCKEDCSICGWNCHIDYSCVEKCLKN